MIDFIALAQRLEKAGVGKVAKTIFVDSLPLECPTGVVLRSSISGDEINYEVYGLMKATFRLIIRVSNHAEGYAMMEKALKALTFFKPRQVGNMWVRSCRPITTPMIFPLSNGNMREFAVNMRIIYDEDVDIKDLLADDEEILKPKAKK